MSARKSFSIRATSGFSLIELMIATGIGVVLFFSVTSVMQLTMSSLQELEFRRAVSALRDELLHMASNPKVIQASMLHTVNNSTPDFAVGCLIDRTTCPLTPQSFMLFTESGSPWKPSAGKKYYFDHRAQPCTPASLPARAPCAFEITVTWRPLCTVGCVNPTLLVLDAVFTPAEIAGALTSINMGAYSPQLVIPFATVRPTINILNSSVNYNLFTALGSPVAAVDIVLVVNRGAVISSTSTSLPALDLGPLPSGSRVEIRNYGSIIGAGGRGGDGDAAMACGNPNIHGANGGPALRIASNVDIYNYGYIWGGGGGGGGGASDNALLNGNHFACGGGGGGGGGNNPGVGGAATGSAGPGDPGLFAIGGSSGLPAAGICSGGSGGDPGSPGGNGIGYASCAGGTGGLPGAAVLLNGFSAVWHTGGGSVRVRGPQL